MLLFEEFYKSKEFNWKLGLERVKKALKEFREKDYPSIIVAGTNGKGSVSFFLSEILKKHGLKVGLFTSPHLVRFNERIRVNLKEVSDSVLNEAFKEVKPLIERWELTYFEGSLLLALEVFKNFKVDCAVFEVGLGGRLDATNALRHQLGVLTSVSYDHKNFLGNTLEKIAEEKLAVFKEGMVGVFSKGALIPYVKEKVSKLPVEAHLYRDHFWEDEVQVSLEGSSFYYLSQVPVKIKMIGHHQCVNCACALKSSSLFLEKFLGKKFQIPEKLEVSPPGRFEVLKRNPTVIFDVAHNEEALNTLFLTLKGLGLRLNVVYGSLKDKEQLKNLKVIKNYLNWSGGKLFFMEVKNERGLKFKEFLSYAEKLDLKVDSFLKELNLNEFNLPVVVTGSFYLKEKLR